LEKVKPILLNLSSKDKKFYNIHEFNEIYKIKLEPIKNCYVLTRLNWKNNFLFWLQLESYFYKLLYKNKYFYYPSYDVKPAFVCTGYCYDSNRSYFEYTVSHPCRVDKK
jgi:hypothetical protein